MLDRFFWTNPASAKGLDCAQLEELPTAPAQTPSMGHSVRSEWQGRSFEGITKVSCLLTGIAQQLSVPHADELPSQAKGDVEELTPQISR